jgi:hypothetical protein
MRRKRYQKGSLQKRKHGRFMMWVGLWRQDGSRLYKTLGRCSEMSQGDARVEFDSIMQPVNREAQEQAKKPVYTFKDFVTSKLLAVLPTEVEGVHGRHVGATN